MLLLRERGFLLLWIGQFLNVIGAWSLRTVLLIWVYTLTRSGVAVSIVGLAEAAPLLLLGPVVGVFVDRWHRAHTMAISSLVAAIFVLPLLAVTTTSGIPLIIAAAILVNSGNQFFMTAASAAIPVVVGTERAGQANSLLSLLNGVIAIMGPAAAAVLFATAGPHGAVLVSGCFFLMAIPIVFLIPAPRAAPGDTNGSTVMREIADGLHYVHRSRLLTVLVVLAFVAFLGIGALSVLDVVFVTRALHLHSPDVGVLYSTSGLGELIGGLAMSIIGSRVAHKYHLLLGSSIICSAVAFLGYAVSPTLWIAAAFLFFVGLTFPPLIVSFMTLVQLVTEDAYMGRVNSVINTAIAISMILSLVSGGTFADLFGVRQVIAAAAVLFGVSGFLSLYYVRSTPAVRGALIDTKPVAIFT